LPAQTQLTASTQKKKLTAAPFQAWRGSLS